ncbi:MAG TPA: DUF1636 domain-containing protein [Candidatus Competibacteraceae bacterium]|nr:DUF1636 domain-containing protein [Candidatus Competibacteraceae bacterium]
MSITLYVCQTCTDTTCPGAAGMGGGGRLRDHLLAALREHPAAEAVRLHPTNCLMACTEGCNVALSAPGRMQYVLGRFPASAESAAAILDYAALYAASPDGTVPYRQWPEAVKGHFLARIPALAR